MINILVKQNGLETIKAKTIEELKELIEVVEQLDTSWTTNNHKYIALMPKLITEAADVLIMIEQLATITDTRTKIENEKYYKVIRQLMRNNDPILEEIKKEVQDESK